MSKIQRILVATALVGVGVSVGATIPYHNHALAVACLFAVGCICIAVEAMKP